LFKLPDGGQAEAGATIITPLETLLTEQVTLSVDGGKAKRYPFTFCGQIGCFARIGLTGADIASFKAGSAAKMYIVPIAAPDQKIEIAISLSGFTAGYAAVSEANAPKQ
jgi:invasion protein IalB